MEKKSTIFSLIFVFAVVLSAVTFIIISGITTRDYNYVQIEVNPKVEFICDKKFKVVSFAPLNADARIVLSDMDLIGLDVEKATTKFLDECAKTGFIDVDGSDNATNITVVDGLTQALDVHVTRQVYKYFLEKQILAGVIENYEDRTMFDKKKENKLCCPNKYKLITTIMSVDPERSFDTLKKFSEVNLVEITRQQHINNPYTPTAEEKQTKQNLIEKNKDKYEKHMSAITNENSREFSETFDDFQKYSIKGYKQDFEKEYTNWQKDRSN